MQVSDKIIHRLYPKGHVTIPSPLSINVEVTSFHLPVLSQPELMSIDATLSSPEVTLVRGDALPLQLVDARLHLQANTFKDMHCELTSQDLSLSVEGAIDLDTRIFTPRKGAKLTLTVSEGGPFYDLLARTNMALSQPARLTFAFYGDKIPFDIDMPYATDMKVKVSAGPVFLHSMQGKRRWR
jgi:hypothetical protein